MRILSCLAGIVAVGITVNATFVTAQSDIGEVRGSELAASVNLIKKDVKIDGTFFLPKKVDRVRAVIVVIGWGIGGSVYRDPEFRRLVETLNSGLLLATVTNIGPTETDTPVGAARAPTTSMSCSSRVRRSPT
jgi:hypothetical protein